MTGNVNESIAIIEFADETDTVQFTTGYQDSLDNYFISAGASSYSGNGLVVNGSGNVGIGTATPSSKLDVAGTITSTGLKMTGGTPGAGKVLTSDAAGNASWTTVAGGTVTSVSGTGAISVANGTTTPEISIATANGTTTGALSSADWNTFSAKENALTFDAPLSRSTNTISIPAATSIANGYLTSADWLSFNGAASATTAATNANTASTIVKRDASGNFSAGTISATFSGDGSALTSLNASNLSSGTMAAARMPAFTGDVTTSAGSTATTIANGAISTARIADGAVTAAKLGTDVGAWTASGSDVYRSAGRVGIGTNVPSDHLHVAGGGVSTIRNEMSTWLANNGVSGETDWSQNAYYSSGWKYRLADEASRIQMVNGNVVFSSASAGAADGPVTWTDNVMILENGNAGIGTATPSSKLDVAGTITSTGLKMTGGTPGAGKVLTSDAAGNASWTTVAGGTVTSVSGTGAISVANGTTTPEVSIATANGTTTGALSSADWNTFSAKENALTFDAPLSRSTNTISIPAATSVANGYLTSADWLTFNGAASATTAATSANTASTIVKRDASGNFSAGAITATSISGDGSALTSLNASNLSSGMVAGARMPAFTGDVTTSAGSTATTIANGAISTAKIADGAVTAAKLGTDVGAWTASGSDAYRSAGNVGIGTTNPGQKLDVAGNIKFPESSAIRTANAGGEGNILGATGGVLNVGDSQGTMNNLTTDIYSKGQSFINVGSASGYGLLLKGDNAAPGWVSVATRGVAGQTADIFQVQNSSSTVLMNVSSAGNVGIGTTNPGASLDTRGEFLVYDWKTDRNVGVKIYGSEDIIGAGKTAYIDTTQVPSCTECNLRFKTDGWFDFQGYGIANIPAISSAGNVTFRNNSLLSWDGASLTGGAGIGLGISTYYGTTFQKTNANPAATMVTKKVAGQTGSLFQWEDETGAVLGAIDSSGKVGIGTSSPSEFLEVRKDDSGSYTRLSINNSSGSRGATLALKQGSARNATLFYENAADILHLANENNDAGGPIYFATDGSSFSAAMMISGAGSVGIGTTAPGYRLHTVVTGTGAVAGFQNDTGTCTITPNTSSLSCSSDIRLKTDIKPIAVEDALRKVLDLQGMTYQWKKGDRSRHIGFIAQEVEKTVPELVTEGADGYKQVSYSGFVPVLTEAIKAIYDRLTGQDRRLASIEARDAANNAQIAELKAENAQKDRQIQELRAAVCDINPKAKVCEKTR